MFDPRKFLINARPATDIQYPWIRSYLPNEEYSIDEQHRREWILYSGLIAFGDTHTVLTLQMLEKKYNEMTHGVTIPKEAAVTQFDHISCRYLEWVGKWGWILDHYSKLQTAWNKT